MFRSSGRAYIAACYVEHYVQWALTPHPEYVNCGERLGAAQKLQNLPGVLAACPGIIPDQEQQLHASLELVTACAPSLEPRISLTPKEDATSTTRVMALCALL